MHLREFECDLNRIVPSFGRDWSNLIQTVGRMHGVDRLSLLRLDPSPLPRSDGFCRFWGAGTHEGALLSLLVLEIFEAWPGDIDEPRPRRTFLAFEREWPWAT